MTEEPDEALLWAREQLATFWEKAPGVRDADRAVHVNNARSGASDWDLEDAVRGRLHWLDGNRAGSAASAERVTELEAALAKANEPEWFFLNTGVPYPSLYEAVGQRVDPNGSQTQLVKVDTGRACKTIWAAVRILGPGGEWSLTPCATEAEARALLKEPDQ